MRQYTYDLITFPDGSRSLWRRMPGTNYYPEQLSGGTRWISDYGFGDYERDCQTPNARLLTTTTIFGLPEDLQAVVRACPPSTGEMIEQDLIAFRHKTPQIIESLDRIRDATFFGRISNFFRRLYRRFRA